MPEVGPVIAVGELCLRPLQEDDRDAILDLLSDPAVTERTSYPRVNLALVDGMIAKSAARWAAGEPGKWGLLWNGRVVGTCGFHAGSPEHRWAELGYDLARPLWGRGWMTAAVGAALRWAFSAGGLNRVQAFVRVDNGPSERLLLRQGFVREGRLRGYRICRGVPADFFVYGRLWEDVAAAGG